MNVSLTPELEKLVQGTVDSGRYHSASEVVRDALRLMEERDSLRALELRELRGRIDRGLADAEQGRAASGETFMRGLIESAVPRKSRRKAG